MRRFLRVFTLVVSLASIGVATGVSGAGAGVTPIGAAPLTILKTVSGAVPAGTTFTATVQCDGTIIDGTSGATDTATVQFDATGQPTSADTLTFSGPGACTVTETADGGAVSTTYACEGTAPTAASGFGAGAQQVQEPICPTAGPQTDPITVNIIFENQDATVTIHNTFPEPPPPPPVTPAAQVVAQPAFTG